MPQTQLGFEATRIAAGDVFGDGGLEIVASDSTSIAIAAVGPDGAFPIVSRSSYAEITDVALSRAATGSGAELVMASTAALWRIEALDDGGLSRKLVSDAGMLALRNVPLEDGGAVLIGVGVAGDVAMLVGADAGWSMVELAPPCGATSLMPLDADGDSDPDLLVFLADGGAITYLGAAEPLVGGIAADVSRADDQVAIDLNGDGRDDVVTVSAAYPALTTLYFSNGDGTFTRVPPQIYFDGLGPLVSSGPAPQDATLRVADLDGDGTLDLFAMTNDGTLVHLTTDATAGELVRRDAYAIGASAGPFTVADVNGDGLRDVIAAGSSITVTLAAGPWQLRAFSYVAPVHGGPTLPTHVGVGDFDGDRRPDIVFDDGTAWTKAFLLNQGDGGYAPRLSIWPSLVAFEVGDVLGRGRDQVIAAYSSQPQGFDLIDMVTGSLTVALDGGSLYSQDATALVIAPLLPDGGTEVVAPFMFGGEGSTHFFAMGPGATTTPIGYVDEPLGHASWGDFNGDQRFDVVTTTPRGALLAFENSPTGLLPPALVADGGYDQILAADFNADGKAEVVVAGLDLDLFTFEPEAGWSTSTIAPGIGTVGRLRAADVNGDAKVDLVVGTLEGVRVFLGQGDRTFQPVALLRLPTAGASDVATGDLRGIGFSQIVTANLQGVAIEEGGCR